MLLPANVNEAKDTARIIFETIRGAGVAWMNVIYFARSAPAGICMLNGKLPLHSGEGENWINGLH
jgi:hypothetical protein